MLNQSRLKISLLMAGLATLGACGSSNEPSTENPLSARPTSISSVDVDDTEDTDADSVGGSDDDAVTGTTDEDNGGGNVTDLANPIPIIASVECGTLPISATEFSNSESAPAVFSTGEIVKGRIDPESASNTEHFWNIELQPGHYHLVVDTRRVDDSNRIMGLDILDLNGPDEDDDELLLRTNDTGEFTLRNSNFFEVETADTLNLQVIPRRDAEDYTIGIFENGSAVPSPAVEECPFIQTVSLDSTQSLTVPEYIIDSDELWYRFDLELGDFVLNSTASREDGTEGFFSYAFRSVDQFGQTDRYDQVTEFIGSDTIVNMSSDVLPVSEDGPVWVRLRALEIPVAMEFTLTSDN